ncbi:MAG: dihydrodipicolinate synthase family protein [Terriglobia bacterium]
MTHREVFERLRGIFPPVVTPFDRRGKLEEAALRANIRKYTGIGLSGILVAGSTGEAPHLTLRERLRVIEVARAVVEPPELLIAGTGLESTAQTLELSRDAAACGADAVLIVPPTYYKPMMRPDVLSAHFRRIADGVRIPVLVYSIPQYTGYRMDVAVLGRLSRHPNIVGIKESSGDFQFLQAILDNVGRNFRVLVGSASILVEGLKAGAAGAILGQSNFEPHLCIAIYEAFAQGDLRTAERLQERLMILVREITAPLSIPGIKAALDLSGIRGGYPRPPLAPVGPAARRKIAAALKHARQGLDV